MVFTKANKLNNISAGVFLCYSNQRQPQKPSFLLFLLLFGIVLFTVMVVTANSFQFTLWLKQWTKPKFLQDTTANLNYVFCNLIPYLITHFNPIAIVPPVWPSLYVIRFLFYYFVKRMDIYFLWYGYFKSMLKVQPIYHYFLQAFMMTLKHILD